MFGKFMKLFGIELCEHDFKIAKTVAHSYFDYELDKAQTDRWHYLYCPRCDMIRRVNADRYDKKIELEKRKKYIKDNYISQKKENK